MTKTSHSKKKPYVSFHNGSRGYISGCVWPFLPLFSDLSYSADKTIHTWPSAARLI